MQNNLATTHIETRSLQTPLPISLPAWINPRDLDSQAFYMPEVRAGQGNVCRAVAASYRAAMQPATVSERVAILRELRLGTAPRRESDIEARAVFEKLVADLADVPADILRDGCFAYANAPGANFFPRSPGEVRAFTAGPQATRLRRAFNLDRIAKACDEAWTKPEDDRLFPSEVDEANALMKRFGIATRYRLDGSLFQLQKGDVDPVKPPVEEKTSCAS